MQEEPPKIEGLSLHDKVDGHFLLNSMQLRKTKNNKDFLILEFKDQTGTIKSKIWDNVDYYIKTFKELPQVAHIKGIVTEYNNNLELKVMQINIEEGLKPMDFLPKAECDISEVFKKVWAFSEKINDPEYKALYIKTLEDPEVSELFQKAPAGKFMHHAYIGGLIVHTLTLLSIADELRNIYPKLNYDLLITGILYHDIGKIYELSYDKGFGYTERGERLGHMMLGASILNRISASIPEFNNEKVELLTHLILSHHGTKEWGSPVTPVIPESVALHHIDNLDSKLSSIIADYYNNDKSEEN